MNSYKGFTLIELMITVTIMSILLTVGLPSFQSIIASSRLTSAANGMVSALQLARVEAVKQSKPVVIAKKNGNWQNGWVVFVDLNSTSASSYVPVQDANEPTLASFDSLSPTIMVKNNLATSGTQLYYKISGQSNKRGTFSFCTNPGTNQDFRSVVIAATGRIHVESASSKPSSIYTNDCK